MPISPEPSVPLDKLSQRVAGRTISHMQSGAEKVTIHFTDGSALTLSAGAEHVVASLRESRGGAVGGVVNRPSSRQQDYIDFIRRSPPGTAFLRRRPTWLGTSWCQRLPSIRWSEHLSDADTSPVSATLAGRRCRARSESLSRLSFKDSVGQFSSASDVLAW